MQEDEKLIIKFMWPKNKLMHYSLTVNLYNYEWLVVLIAVKVSFVNGVSWI